MASATSTTVYLYPKTHVLTFQTNPTGLTVSGGGTSGPAPVQATFIEGTGISLVAPPLQTLGGTQYGFVSWSDGGGATHSLSVPAADATYTARYIPDSRLAGPDRYGTSAAAAATVPGAPGRRLRGYRRRVRRRRCSRGDRRPAGRAAPPRPADGHPGRHQRAS